MHGDHVGVVDVKHGLDRLQQVRLAAEDRRAFGKRTGAGHHRLLVMPGKGAAVIGAASLRAVAVRQAVMHAQRRIHGADRLAGLGRIDSERGALHDFAGCMSQQHRDSLSPRTELACHGM